ncbi:MAG: ABC transporter ATP-binding protein [Methylocystaceae bacterium]
MIEISKISKRFADITALSEVTAQIDNGSIFGLVGTNGAGKSTLLRILSGIYRQDSGQVWIDGQTVYENTNLKQSIFYISDDQYYFYNSSMEDMKRYYQCVYHSFSADIYNRLLKVFRLDEKRKINTFSKGMARQAFIIFGLASRPRYLFCDETFDGLDPVMRQAVKRLIADSVAEHQMTPIIASHNLRELEDICDHVGLLHQGGIVFDMDIDTLQAGIHKVQCAFETEKSGADFNDLKMLSFTRRGRLCTMVVRGDQSAIMAEIDRQRPQFCEAIPLSLEEIFIAEMEVIGYEVSKIIL